MKKLRALLSAALMIMLSASIAVAGTYALFSDSVEVTNHLQAGTLKVGLERTNLTVRALDENGVLQTTTNANTVSFEEPNNSNIFDLDNKLIAPGAYSEATMQIKNKGNVAFVYSVQIELKENSDAELANQVNVWVKIGNGEYVNKGTLSDFAPANYIVTAGNHVDKNATESFMVKLEFPGAESNNEAQAKSAYFDLIVFAEQYVPAETTV